MTVSATDMAELARLEALMPPDRDGAEHLNVIETVDELFGFVIADARSAGDDECDAVEMLARHSDMSPDEVRSVATTLKALGYRTAATRLAEITGRRKHDLRPLR
jgi:hypothetical protein